MAEFKIMSVDMGQGDCTVIQCPDGKVVIIDCGSAAGLPPESFQAANDTLNAWLGGQTIWALIITHPDKDHYNKFWDFLVNADNETLPVKEVFFSSARSEISPLGNYNQSGIGNELLRGTFGNVVLIEVSLTPHTQEIKKWLGSSSYQVSTPNDVENHQALVVKNDGDENLWSINVIAGNVPSASRSASEKSNAASLVVLLKTANQKILFTGDATTDTQDYLYNTFHGGTTISDLHLMQIPHHGSAGCASTDQFRALLNPRGFIVSVGIINDSHRLPRYSVLNAWLGGARVAAPPHPITIDYWKTPEEGGIDERAQIQAAIDAWNTAGHEVLNNVSCTFYWLSDPANATADSYYGITYTGFTIFRVEVDKDIYETGINGTQYFNN